MNNFKIQSKGTAKVPLLWSARLEPLLFSPMTRMRRVWLAGLFLLLAVTGAFGYQAGGSDEEKFELPMDTVSIGDLVRFAYGITVGDVQAIIHHLTLV